MRIESTRLNETQYSDLVMGQYQLFKVDTMSIFLTPMTCS